MRHLSKIILGVVFSCTFFGNIGYAQNPLWSLPSDYIDLNGPHPLPTVSSSQYGYHGDPTECTSNAMPDANGDLLFFIVDGEIYDKDGYLIGVLDFMLNSSLDTKGTAEIAIVPVPGNCSQYYIFMAGRKNYVNSFSSKEPVVALLDMSEPSSIPSNSTNKMGNILYCKKIQSVLPNTAPSILYGSGVKQGSSYFAASKENNGERFVFISTARDIYRFIIDAAGLHYDGVIPVTFPSGNNDIPFRGEMELVETNNGGNVKYRLAFYIPYVAPINSGQHGSNVVYVYNLDFSGNIAIDNNGIDKYYLAYENNPQTPISNRAYIHGLEFSPNGEILYITHQANSDYPSAFDFFDFNTISAGIQSVPGATTQDALNFENSQIEIGKSGKLYLAYAGGLATFSNPNTPNLGLLNLSALTFNYSANREGDLGNDSRLKSYMLPDQIDGMDYGSIAYPSLHTITSYTANSSGTWQPGQNPWNINNTEVYVQDQLIIPSGKNITIENMTFHFAPDAEVLVKQGGKLTLDNGSVFTNAKVSCDNSQGEFWQGVQVYGTTNQHQYPYNQPDYQGMLVLKNGGTIENAHVAATNWKTDDWNAIGGVIQSTDGVFRNNRRDVAFMSYSNHPPSNPFYEISNRSTFKNTDFVTDDDFIEKGLGIQDHVSLWDVKGIRFNNCHFENNITTDKNNSSAPDRGIYSLNAGFVVLAGCSASLPSEQPCPQANLLKSSFVGLRTAIEATGAGTSETATISQSDFINNKNGVLINEFDNVSINRNTMLVDGSGYNPNPFIPITEKGIEINNSTGFIVEENDVTGTYSQFDNNNSKSYGIIIRNAGGDENRVYNNDLASLKVGTDAIGLNRNEFYNHIGLQFLCNSYQNYKYAINIGEEPDDGIRLYQGDYNANSSLSVPAGNTFLGYSLYFTTWDINNGTDGSIVYFHNPNTPNSTPQNSNGFYYVTLSSTSETNSCASSFNGGGVIFQPSYSFKPAIDSLESVYNGLRYNYLSLLDGGDTEQLQTDIDNSWSDDAWDLRAKLVEASPFLSAEVLLNTASKNVLPDAMLLEVLLANPGLTSRSSFIDKLLEVTNNTFPAYMISYLLNNKEERTTRRNMEEQMASVHAEISVQENVFKHRVKMKDSISSAERLAAVKLGNSIPDKIGELDFYIQQKQWRDAKSMLDSIQNAGQNESQLKLLNKYDEYIDFRESIGNRKLSQLDSSEVTFLKTLAEEEGRVAGFAQNILCFFYNTCYTDTITIQETSGNSSNTANTAPANEVLYNLSLSPNPARSKTTIQWTIYDKLQNCKYVVQRIKDGSIVAQGKITQNEGDTMINVNQFLNGYYVVKIINNGNLKADKKLVVE